MEFDNDVLNSTRAGSVLICDTVVLFLIYLFYFKLQKVHENVQTGFFFL